MDLQTRAALLRPLIEPRVDYYFEDCAFLWYELRDDDGLDLVPESASDEFMHVPSPLEKPQRKTLTTLRGPDSPPDVFQIEELEPDEPRPEIMARWEGYLEDVDFDLMMDVSHDTSTKTRYLDWALREGLLPRQPFLICVAQPRWYRCSWEYVEYDVEVEAVIVDRLPPESTARDLARFIDEATRCRHLMAEDRAELERIQRMDVDRMYISVSWYYATRWWDDMAAPDGICYSLYTTRVSLDEAKSWHGVQLASGRSDKGDHKEAMQNLRDVVAKELPHVTSRLESMPRRHQ